VASFFSFFCGSHGFSYDLAEALAFIPLETTWFIKLLLIRLISGLLNLSLFCDATLVLF